MLPETLPFNVHKPATMKKKPTVTTKMLPIPTSRLLAEPLPQKTDTTTATPPNLPSQTHSNGTLRPRPLPHTHLPSTNPSPGARVWTHTEPSQIQRRVDLEARLIQARAHQRLGRTRLPSSPNLIWAVRWSAERCSMPIRMPLCGRLSAVGALLVRGLLRLLPALHPAMTTIPDTDSWW